MITEVCNSTRTTKLLLQLVTWTKSGFYRAMNYSAKHGIEIACRLSVRLSVCLSVTLVDQDHIGWKPWKLKTNCMDN